MCVIFCHVCMTAMNMQFRVYNNRRKSCFDTCRWLSALCPGRLWASPSGARTTGTRPWGRRGTCWRDYISQPPCERSGIRRRARGSCREKLCMSFCARAHATVTPDWSERLKEITNNRAKKPNKRRQSGSWVLPEDAIIREVIIHEMSPAVKYQFLNKCPRCPLVNSFLVNTCCCVYN